MTSAHRRAANRERQAARTLGTTRTTNRPRYTPAPDVAPITLPGGDVLSVEVKTRARLPSLLRRALEQARRYAPGAVPLAVVSETGGPALAVLELGAFARIAGLEVSALARPSGRPRRRAPRREQLSLPI